MATKQTWTKVGECGVDGGMLLVVDPCYIKDNWEDPKCKGFGLDRCIEIACTDDPAALPAGQAGLGVVVQTGYGDGVYPVEARFDAAGRVVEMRVRFIGKP